LRNKQKIERNFFQFKI